MEAMEQEAQQAERKSVAVVTPLAHAFDSSAFDSSAFDYRAVHERAPVERIAGSRLFRGVQTPPAFGDAPAELRAALVGAVVHDLGWRRRIAVTGEDRLRWLSGMVTNHVAGLAENASNYNLVLNAQGRIQGDCCVWRGADASLELEMDEEQREALTTHLERFIIMDDVELKPRVGWTALGVAGPQAMAVLQRALVSDVSSMQSGAWTGTVLRGAAETSVEIRRETGRQSGHWELWCREESVWTAWQALQEAGAQAVGCEAVERLRIVQGVPAFGVDFGGDTLPQETALDEALHFAKGCYLGQEIVERIHSRGQVHRHVRALEMFAEEQEPVAGIELSRADEPGKPAARVSSVACVDMDGARRWFALGMVRTEADAAELQYAGGRARVRRGGVDDRIERTRSKGTE